MESINRIKVELKSEPATELENPMPSTSMAGVLDPAFGVIQAQIQQLTRLFNQHLNKSDSIIEGAQSERVQANKVPKEEPKDAEPPTDKDQESDTEKCIQNLEDHLAATQTDENPEGQQSTREDVLQDSDTENQGVEEVGSSGSSQEEITVNPSNNIKKKPMLFPTKRNRHAVTNRKSRQILIHQVPVRFPVAGNLMENVESLGYIYGALSNINEPDDLPGDVVVNATLLNRMENNQDRATLVVELDTEDRCNQILRKAKKKHAQDKRFEYYITPKPRRLHTRNMSYSDEEIQTVNNAKYRKAEETKEGDKKEKEPKQKYRGTPNAGTPKRPRVEPESGGPSKKPRVKPENARPANAVSTPLPGTSRINPDAPVDLLAELVRGLSGVAPVPRIDAPRSQERTPPSWTWL